MKKWKNSEGITIISMVITIVVLLILASIMIATFNGESDTFDKANDSKIYTELKQLQDILNTYKAESHSNKNLKKGNFSGKLTNDDLVYDGLMEEYSGIMINVSDIVRASSTDKTKNNAIIGAININKLGVTSSLGNGFKGGNVVSKIEPDTSKTNITEFNDVFAIDVNDNTLYYVREQKVWKLQSDNLVNLKISVSPTSGEINKETKFTINVQGENLSETNEYKYYFSKNEQSLNETLENEYTSGNRFTFSGTEAENYYLFVKEISDDLGNVSQKYGDKVEIDGVNYHRFGPYTYTKSQVDDNSIEFEYSYENGDKIHNYDSTKWYNQNIKVDVIWGASLTNKQIQSTSNNCVISSSNAIAKDSQKITASANGSNGNVQKETNIKIDKNDPTIAIANNTGDRALINGQGTVRTNISLTDNESGINYTLSQYGWSDSDENEPENWINISLPSTNIEKTLTDNENHYLWVKTIDVAGNQKVEKKSFKMAESVAKVIIENEQTVYFSLQEAFDACPKDGTKVTVELLKDIDEGSSTYAGQNILLNLAGHNISNTNANANDVTIINNASLQIVHSLVDELELPNYSAKIEGNGNTVIQNNSGATLTLGTNDDTILSGEDSENFVISGVENGIVNNGVFNYYDGVIKGRKSLTTSDVTTPEGKNVITIKRNNIEISYLGSIATYSARIGNIYYPTLQLAVNDCKTGETITLVRPNALTESLIISDTKDVIIDLDNYDISSNSQIDYIIKNNGRLNIISSNETKKGSIIGTTSGTIFNDEDGYLRISGAQITISKVGTKTGNNINYENAIYNQGELVLENNANVNATANYTCGIYNEGTFTNNGGNISGDSSLSYGKYPVLNKGEYINNLGTVGEIVYNDVAGIMNINGGNVGCIYNYSEEELLVKGGKIYKDKTYAIINKSENGVIKIKDNAIVHGIQNDNSKGLLSLTVEGGTINNAIYGYNGNNNINISGGTIGEISLSSSSNQSNINITGGTINKINDSAKAGSITVESGNVENGIDSSKSQITIGKNDGNIISNLPLIKGGIKTNGNPFKFYDGIIVAVSNSYPAITGEITEIAENAELEYGLQNNKETVSLKAIDNPIAKIIKSGEDVNYYNLQDAINAYNGEESGIIISRDFTSIENTEIINGKDILIDLNGKNINAVKSNFISNNGNLTIKDLNGNGKITSKVETPINNNGTLNLQGGSFIIDCEGTWSTYKNNIINKGVLNLNGAVIKGTKSYVYLITNEGTLNFISGTIGDTVYKTIQGIYNTGTCNLTGGTIQRMGTGINNSTGANVNLNGTQIILYSGTSKTGTGISNVDGNIDIRGNSKIEASTGINDSSKTKGTINIYGGEITGSSYGVYLSGKADIDLVDGTITGSQGVTISGTVDFDMDGGKIQSTGQIGLAVNGGTLDFEMNAGTIEVSSSSGTVYGINCYTNYNSNQDIKIKGGTITATSTNKNGNAYGIRMLVGNNNSQQKLTLGTKDGTVNDPHNPVIIGKTYGVYNESNRELNFYDGIVKTVNLENSPIEGDITAWEDEYKIINDEEEGYNVTYLGKDVKVAQIVGGDSYTSLAEALDKCAASGKSTIELLGNTTEDANMEISENQEIVLDLKGKTITASNEEVFTNNGIFKIKDSIGNGSINAKNGTAVNNNNQFSLDGGNINIDKEGIQNNYISGIVNSSTFDINGGSIKTNQNYIKIINNSGTINMTSGLISAENYKLNVDVIYNEGTCNLNGGEIKGGTYGVNNRQDGNVILNGVTIDIYNNNNKVGYGICNLNGNVESDGTTLIEAGVGIQDVSTTNGTITIRNGTIKANTGVQLEKNAELNIYGGEIEGSSYGIHSSGNTEFNMSGGKISSPQYSTLRIIGSINMNMTGGTIEMASTSNSSVIAIECYALYGTNQILNIKGGTITATTSSNIGSAYGIKVSYNGANTTQRLTLGENDGNINNPHSPVIVGKTIGIYNEANREIYFYDGIVKGNSGVGSAIDGNVTGWADGYQIITDVEEGTESAYLGNDKYVAKIGENSYYTLNDAFLACSDNTKTTIELLRNIVNNTNIQISANKDVVLDLKGRIIVSTTEKGFINNGKFEIKDSEQDGIIKCKNGIVLENNNLFTLTNGTISIDKKGESNSKVTGISNNSVINIVNGTIKATKNNIYTIYNNTEGTINFQNGTIGDASYIADSTGIYNLGTLNLTGGVIQKVNYGIENSTGGYVNLNGTQIKNIKYGYGISNKNGTIEVEGESVIEAGTGIYDRSANTTPKGLINIKGGNISVYSTGIDVENSEINMSAGRIEGSYGQTIGDNSVLNLTGGEIVATTAGIYFKGNGNCNINGGTITSTGLYGVNMSSTGKLKMEKGNIIVNVTGNSVANGIYYYYNAASGGNIQIEGGTITATSENKEAYGINLAKGNPSLTIGIKDKTVRTNNPIITGKTYGVYNSINKNVYFYDGTIKGKTSSIAGIVTQVEDKNTIIQDVEDDYVISYLEVLNTDMVTAFVTGTYYETLQQAIDACDNNVETYVIMANGCTLNGNVEIGNNQNIILDLNGYSITTSSDEYSIINNGKLKIIDTSEEHSGSINDSLITGTGTYTRE